MRISAGIINLALEGFRGFGAFIGALSAVLIANASGKDVQDLFYVALIFSMIGGMTFSIIHALLCIKFRQIRLSVVS